MSMQHLRCGLGWLSGRIARAALAVVAGAAFAQPTWGGSSTVILDTGHTAARPGSRSASGIGEYEFNLRLTNAVSRLLRADGVTVNRVAAYGADVRLVDRTAGSGAADLFVSVHHDSIQQDWIDQGRRDEFAGFAVFASRLNVQAGRSVRCAQLLGEELVRAGERPSLYHATPIRGENRPLIDAARGVHYFDDLVVLKSSMAPAVLIEAGVIANPAQEHRLGEPKVVERLAMAIATGVRRCLVRSER